MWALMCVRVCACVVRGGVSSVKVSRRSRQLQKEDCASWESISIFWHFSLSRVQVLGASDGLDADENRGLAHL